MPTTFVKVPTISDLHDIVNRAVDDYKGKDVYIYYHASDDPATGKSWCPDCVRADPVVEEQFANLDDAVLLNVGVGDRLTWKDLNHPYRHDTTMIIKSIPTLVHWKSKSKLVENECEDPAKVREFITRG